MHPKTFSGIATLTRVGLSICYGNIKNRSVSLDEFSREILSVVAGLDNKEIEDPVEIVMQFVSDEAKNRGRAYLSSSPYSSILVASAFLFRAISTYAKDADLAWSYMADARYWYGVVKCTGGIEKAYAETVINTKRDTASRGAKARNEKFSHVKEYAQELARSLCPKSGWKSRNHAVQFIKEKVAQFAIDKNIGLSSAQADVTLSKWLAEMPDTVDLFPTKKIKKEL